MRIKRMDVSFELLRSLLAQDNFIPATKVISDGLPADTVVTGVALLSGDAIQLTLHSAEFPEVEEGQEIPWLNPMFETIRDTANVT